MFDIHCMKLLSGSEWTLVSGLISSDNIFMQNTEWNLLLSFSILVTTEMTFLLKKKIPIHLALFIIDGHLLKPHLSDYVADMACLARWLKT